MVVKKGAIPSLGYGILTEMGVHLSTQGIRQSSDGEGLVIVGIAVDRIENF